MKNLNNLPVNKRTRDFLVCSTVSQPTEITPAPLIRTKLKLRPQYGTTLYTYTHSTYCTAENYPKLPVTSTFMRRQFQMHSRERRISSV